jgi:hypothetical protein
VQCAYKRQTGKQGTYHEFALLKVMLLQLPEFGNGSNQLRLIGACRPTTRVSEHTTEMTLQVWCLLCRSPMRAALRPLMTAYGVHLSVRRMGAKGSSWDVAVAEQVRAESRLRVVCGRSAGAGCRFRSERRRRSAVGHKPTLRAQDRASWSTLFGVVGRDRIDGQQPARSCRSLAESRATAMLG